MKKIVFLYYAVTTLPVCAMEEADQSPYTMTAQQARDYIPVFRHGLKDLNSLRDMLNQLEVKPETEHARYREECGLTIQVLNIADRLKAWFDDAQEKNSSFIFKHTRIIPWDTFQIILQKNSRLQKEKPHDSTDPIRQDAWKWQIKLAQMLLATATGYANSDPVARIRLFLSNPPDSLYATRVCAFEIWNKPGEERIESY